MREIKFRAWDNRNKRFTKQFYVSADGKPYTYWDDPLPNALDIVLMQYTGLKDKNGVEIYEGDILRNGNSLAVVEYSHTEFLAMDVTDNRGCNLLGCESEVIGNVHENSGLLEAA
jgi:uncharacterized phage protein (TIGR01671 family)